MCGGGHGRPTATKTWKGRAPGATRGLMPNAQCSQGPSCLIQPAGQPAASLCDRTPPSPCPPPPPSPGRLAHPEGTSQWRHDTAFDANGIYQSMSLHVMPKPVGHPLVGPEQPPRHREEPCPQIPLADLQASGLPWPPLALACPLSHSHRWAPSFGNAHYRVRTNRSTPCPLPLPPAPPPPPFAPGHAQASASCCTRCCPSTCGGRPLR